jgi:hypothetical protein
MTCPPASASSVAGAYSEPIAMWPAPGSEDTDLGVLMEPEVGHGDGSLPASTSLRRCALIKDRGVSYVQASQDLGVHTSLLAGNGVMDCFPSMLEPQTTQSKRGIVLLLGCGLGMALSEAKKYHAYARECLRLAEETDQADIRERLIELSRAWMELALTEESRHLKGNGGSKE